MEQEDFKGQIAIKLNTKEEIIAALNFCVALANDAAFSVMHSWSGDDDLIGADLCTWVAIQEGLHGEESNRLDWDAKEDLREEEEDFLNRDEWEMWIMPSLLNEAHKAFRRGEGETEENRNK